MTSFILKIIAIITMFCDHIGYGIYKSFSYYNLIGRIAFPIFAFQISEGFLHTKNLKKYFIRLGAFALISQVPFMLFLSIFSNDIYKFNIFFTLFFGLVSIYLFNKIMNTKINKYFKYILSFISIVSICVIAELLKFDYGFFGVAIIFLFYLFRENKLLMSISFILACIIKYGITMVMNTYHYIYVLMCLFTILPIVFILNYNKEQGYKLKYFLYLFYPVHLLLIYFIFR